MIKIIFSVAITILLILPNSDAQRSASFNIEVSHDTLLLGNELEVAFIVKNASGKRFEAPVFNDFNVISGPNISTSMQIVNGDLSQQSTYTYLLEPKRTGDLILESAQITLDDKPANTPPYPIVVLDNPDNIIQENSRGKNKDSFEDLMQRKNPNLNKSTKKERKTIRI